MLHPSEGSSSVTSADIVQQSKRQIDVSYVPSAGHIDNVILLVCEQRSQHRGLVTSLIAYMLVSVCEATRFSR